VRIGELFQSRVRQTERMEDYDKDKPSELLLKINPFAYSAELQGLEAPNITPPPHTMSQVPGYALDDRDSFPDRNSVGRPGFDSRQE